MLFLDMQLSVSSIILLQQKHTKNKQSRIEAGKKNSVKVITGWETPSQNMLAPSPGML